MSLRQAAKTLGVGKDTIRRDVAQSAPENGANHANADLVQYDSTASPFVIIETCLKKGRGIPGASWRLLRTRAFQIVRMRTFCRPRGEHFIALSSIWRRAADLIALVVLLHDLIQHHPDQLVRRKFLGTAAVLPAGLASSRTWEAHGSAPDSASVAIG